MADYPMSPALEDQFRRLKQSLKDAKFSVWKGQNPGEWERPRGPGDTVHQKEETDVQYARGGPVLPRSGSPHRKRR